MVTLWARRSRVEEIDRGTTLASGSHGNFGTSHIHDRCESQTHDLLSVKDGYIMAWALVEFNPDAPQLPTNLP
jgi:hypothetical protein